MHRVPAFLTYNRGDVLAKQIIRLDIFDPWICTRIFRMRFCVHA
jgi:hypothetical protein